MELFLQGLHYALSFIAVISLIVFIHEFGHYIVAKMCGVKIDAFSIGFGREIFGWNDRSGTRWKVAWLPMGGYVKMYGDAGAASNADFDTLEEMSAEEKAKTFHHKSLWKKAAIVGAGPAFNFILTIGVFTYFIYANGLISTEPVAGEIMENSAAQEAGLKAGDRITRINDKEVQRFNDIPYYIATNLGTPVEITFERGGEEKQVTLTPRSFEEEDALGNISKRPLIGIRSQELTMEDVSFPQAIGEATLRTWLICETTVRVLKQMIVGDRTVRELKGPVGIAQLSGQATEKGMSTTLWLIALLSANLGFINLLPIPMLDGGHLLFYAAEAARGRPLAVRVQEYGFRIGFALIITLMAFTVFNDFRNIFS